MKPSVPRHGVAILTAIVMMAAPRALVSQTRPQVLVPVDSTQLALGRKLFESKGLCFSCHGKKGEGLLGPSTKLAGRKFTHTKGSVAELVALIKSGITADQSVSKQVMPARGGSRVTDHEVLALAAYVRHINSASPISEK